MEKEKALWRLVKKRVGFRRHFAIYLFVNALFWCMWLFGKQNEPAEKVAWPLWPTLGWGIGLVFEYLGAYVFTSSHATEREFEKLKRSADL